MRKWQDLAAPDDPDSWHDVSRMWPTKRGTYETADFSTATSLTATGASNVSYAFCAQLLSGTREYVVGGKIWEYSGGSLTDRTGGVALGGIGGVMGAQYGNVSILVMGTANPTVSSTGGNFAAIAGAAQGIIVCTQSNAVLIFNTSVSADGWAASDVGDYTNWTTGESASGRIIATPGPILAAVAYGGHVYVFKSNAIYRMTYVGGVVKWTVELVWYGSGVITTTYPQFQVVATRNGIAYISGDTETSTSTIYLFDGNSPPVILNPLTTLTNAYINALLYHPLEDVLIVAPTCGSSSTGTAGRTSPITALYFYYSFPMGAWGSGVGTDEENVESGASPAILGLGVLQGDFYARANASLKPVYYRYRSVTTNAIYRCAPSAPGASAVCYLQTKKIGTPDQKSLFDRVTPLLRRRTDLGTDSVSLSAEYFREREDASTASTATVSESTQRKRFDMSVTDNYGRFKVTWNALDVEVDDILVRAKPAGRE